MAGWQPVHLPATDETAGHVVGKEHVDKGTSGQGGGRIRVPRPVLAILAALLLALGAAALTSARGSAERGLGPLDKQWWLFAAAAVVLGLATLVKLRERISATDPESTARARLNRGVLVVAAVLTAAVPIVLFLSRFQYTAQTDSCAPQCPSILLTNTARQGGTPLALPSKAASHTGTLKLPLGLILLIISCVLAALIVLGLVLLYLRTRRLKKIQFGIEGAPPPPIGDEPDDEAALGAAVLAGRGALEGEARAAIIACYAAMEDSLAEAGVTRLDSDSPADLLKRATERGVVSGPAPRLLAALFREARFSTHPIGARHLDQARGALDEITAQLTARRTQAASRTAAEDARTEAGTAAASASPGAAADDARTEAGAP